MITPTIITDALIDQTAQMTQGDIERLRAGTRQGLLPWSRDKMVAAGALVAVGVWRNRPAVVPMAAMLALPAIWVNSLAMLVAVIPLWRDPPSGPSGHTDGAPAHLD